MATENIEFKVKIDGVEREIKSVKDLKQAIADLEDELQNAEFGSDNFKKSKEQLDKLTDSLEDMTKSTNDVVDLRKQFEVLEDELFRLAGAGKQNTAEFIKLTKEAASLNKKIDEVNQSLGGNEAERAAMGYGKLSEGLKNLDFKSVKEGLFSIKTALAATGVLLFVQALTYINEKFDLLGKLTEWITSLFYKFTDAIGVTHKAAEAQTKSMIENMDKQQKAVEDRYNSEIKLAKAAGKDTSDLELKKLKELEHSVQSQVNQLESLLVKKKELNEEEQKKYDELQSKLLQLSSDRQAKEIENEKLKQQQLQNLANLEEKLRVGSLSAREKEIDAIKKQQQELINELNKNHEVRLGNELNDTIRYNEDVKRINELTQKQINEVNAKYYKEDSEKRYKKIVEDLNKELELNNSKNKSFSEQLRAEQEAQTALDNQVLQNKLANETQLTDFNLKTNEQLRNEYRQRQWEEIGNDYNKQIQLAQQTNQALQGLSDLYFALKTKNLKKGSKEEEEFARKQFNLNKALSIANTVVSGAQGIVSGLAAPYPQNIVLPIVAGITTAASIAKISATQFTGASGSASAASAPSVPIPAPPTAPQPQEGRRSTTFDESGGTSGTETFRTIQPTITVKAQVVESDMTDAQKRVNRFDRQTTF